MLTSANTATGYYSWRSRLHRTAAGSGEASVTLSCCEAMVAGNCCRSWCAVTPATHPTSSTSCSPTDGTVLSPHQSQPPHLRKQAPTRSPLAPGWRKCSPSAGIPIIPTKEAASTPKPLRYRHPTKPANLPGSP
jgi:hypothetical protein